MPKAGLYEVTIPGESRQDKISADLTSFMKGTHRTFHAKRATERLSWVKREGP